MKKQLIQTLLTTCGIVTAVAASSLAHAAPAMSPTSVTENHAAAHVTTQTNPSYWSPQGKYDKPFKNAAPKQRAAYGEIEGRSLPRYQLNQGPTEMRAITRNADRTAHQLAQSGRRLSNQAVTFLQNQLNHSPVFVYWSALQQTDPVAYQSLVDSVTVTLQLKQLAVMQQLLHVLQKANATTASYKATNLTANDLLNQAASKDSQLKRTLQAMSQALSKLSAQVTESKQAAQVSVSEAAKKAERIWEHKETPKQKKKPKPAEPAKVTEDPLKGFYQEAAH